MSNCYLKALPMASSALALLLTACGGDANYTTPAPAEPTPAMTGTHTVVIQTAEPTTPPTTALPTDTPPPLPEPGHQHQHDDNRHHDKH